MRQLKLKHWQDAGNALLGIGVLLSPWALGFEGDTAAMVNAVVIGMALIAAAMGAILVPHAWEEWTESALGVWLIISPWVLGFTAHREATLAMVIMGLAAVVLSVWTLMIDKDYQSWWRDRAAH